jgi:hypothetical protein
MIDIGSDAHKERFCRQFVASHRRYRPESLAWPELDAAARERLWAIPFWSEVLFTERRAGAIVDAYAAMIADPVVREAVALQGFEEARHADFLRLMIRRYGIAAEERPLDPPGRDPYRTFVDFGYGECLDSFLGFGVFAIARRAGFLPDPMFDLFDTLLREETRHIVFFINWMAWHQARSGRAASWRRGGVAAVYYGRAIGRLVATIRRGRAANGGRDFSATQAGVFLDGFSWRGLVEACVAEHARRMADFDPALLRPRLLPWAGGVALAAMRLAAAVRLRRRDAA